MADCFFLILFCIIFAVAMDDTEDFLRADPTFPSSSPSFLARRLFKISSLAFVWMWVLRSW